ncbi:conserved hypothetical protein [Altererythrobacter sp. B11]|uniref:ABC transporter substrate-binding protein n=1 Tax=Altererythrobacter sp. B11 TaxID=2060312 RepID=UPI000DC6E98E|nr:ABC transporter substrate-binding protein [Altererythrobacter sp. B11]BBC72052.1 conserved hypothetical protein [Altererythrobacter sp. B11]
MIPKQSFTRARIAFGLLLGSLAVLAGMGAARETAPAAVAELHGAPSQRIMSANLCTDLLLLMLVPRSRITSITHLAHEPVAALMPGADAGVPVNHGTAEEVVRDRPDLILASPWTTPAMRRLARKAGARVVEVGDANSFADIRRVTRAVGAAVGERHRAESLIAAMDRDLTDLAANAPARARRVVVWNGDGSVPGEGTLADAIIRAAGGVNVAAKFPDTRYSTYSMEELLMVRPDAILRGVDGYDRPSLRDTAGEHPLIWKAFAGRRLTYPASLYACGTPLSGRLARDLRAELARVPEGGVAW